MRRSLPSAFITAIWPWCGNVPSSAKWTYAMLRAVGGDGGGARGLVLLGQPLRLGSLGVDVELVERLGEIDVPAVAAHRREDDSLAVRRPRRPVVLAVAVRELPLVVAVEADDEDVLAAVAGPADAVELEEDAGEPPRPALAVVLLLVRLVADAAGEGDATRVGRPRDRLDALVPVGQPARLAAVGRQDVELSLRLLLVAVAVRDEGEPASVGRPAGRAVVPLAGGELPRFLGAVERRHPDRRAVGARLLVDPA